MHPHATEERSSRRRWAQRHQGRLGIAVSAVAHAVILGFLVRFSLPLLPGESGFALQRPLKLDVTWSDENPTDNVDVPGTVRMPVDARHTTALRPPAAEIDELRAFYGDDAPTPDGMMGDFVRRSVEQAVKLAAARPEEDLLEQLDGLGARLDGLSDKDRLARLSDQFGRWLGTTKRATEPACEADLGSFDVDSAQIHDVVRETDADGSFLYVAVLIDAEGVSQEVPLEESEGERLYRIMTLIKKHPLLETVYRDVVMAFLDKLAVRTTL